MNERSELISVVKTKNTDRRADVIFVHGINADPRKTWMTDNKLEGFPEESWLYWLGQDIPDVAVWTLGYPASASAWQGFAMPLEERADNIINLLLHHPDLDKNRPIIFITHSMGGLLVKHILYRANSGDCTEPNAKSLIERTKGIVFLSTPHTGSELANLIKRLVFLRTNVNVSELQRYEPNLVKLNNWFGTSFNKLDLQVKEFWETKPTPVGKGLLGGFIYTIVVGKESAKLNLPGVSVTPLDADHSSICWVKSYQFRQKDQLYSNVVCFINECLQPKTTTPPVTTRETPEMRNQQIARLGKVANTTWDNMIVILEVSEGVISPRDDRGRQLRALSGWADEDPTNRWPRVKQALDGLGIPNL